MTGTAAALILLTGMGPPPPILLGGPPRNVRGQSIRHIGLVSPRALFVLRPLGSLLRRLLRIMPQRMPRGFKVDENIGIIPALQREWTAVQHRVTLVQYHIARFHRDIVSLAIVRVHFNGPRLVHVLIDVYDGRAHQWHAIDVGGQDGSFRVDADAVEGTFGDFDVGPFLHGVLGGVPDVAFDVDACAAEAGVFDGDHVRWGIPMIRISIPLGPILTLPILLILILIPKFLHPFPNLLRRPHLLKPQLRIILHARRLPQRHLHTIMFRNLTRRIPMSIPIMLIASLHELIVFLLLLSEVLDGFALVFGRGGIVCGVHIVGEPCVIIGDLLVVDGEGEVDAVSGLVEFVHVLAGEGFGVFLVGVGMGGRSGGDGVGLFGDLVVGRAKEGDCRGDGGGGGGEKEDGGGGCFERAEFSSSHGHGFLNCRIKVCNDDAKSKDYQQYETGTEGRCFELSLAQRARSRLHSIVLLLLESI
mmetsp:Transcript_44335/g.79530  ORF Transcript_44335/g.79530 Transcript_44335/m.79530 type:complete len:474 (+) Transcript_44335:449-1870(+)